MTQTIVYSSYVNIPDNVDLKSKPAWLDDMVEKASAYNSRKNIYGVLGYTSGKILQLIEGDAHEIQALFSKISDDSRHKNVRILMNLKDSTRIFPDWRTVLEPDMTATILFRDFLFAHIDDLVELTEPQADEFIFFIDHIFN